MKRTCAPGSECIASFNPFHDGIQGDLLQTTGSKVPELLIRKLKSFVEGSLLARNSTLDDDT